MGLATPLLRRKLRRRAETEPGYALAVPERFGVYDIAPRGPSEAGRPLIWIHAVSLGETRAAAILLKELRELLPQMQLLLSNGTATGREEGRKLLRGGDIQVWQPWDSRQAVGRFLRNFRPDIGVLMETEIWPNLVAGCKARGIPLVLANARMNEKSWRGAKRFAWLARPAYRSLRAVWAQTESDARRLTDIGAPVRAVLGNLKFDSVPDARLLARGRGWRAASARPVVLFASSREGEEAAWLHAWLAAREALAQRGQQVQWLLVPRHPQRFDEVMALCADAGLTVSRRSTWADEPPTADVWLGDSMGEMAQYYGMAHAAMLGGSFEPLGGQNLIEALSCDCPVIMGPHTFNFAEAAELAAEAGVALRAADMHEGVTEAVRLVNEPARLADLASRCHAFTSAHRGAARSTAWAVVEQMRSTPQPGAAGG
ncbi:3-deoxy-D-manno-octulosonic acid transferase [Diaphorobacter aerolatus]|uniref:3-deoxy-D-manno-octulosonic acid transferase n=1 Tax=Diaphorobacter aerolatus TaxID=1288495 RepID=A0A7H0GQ17_9BURK|nr:3-deoxy-D-manno-octulosonic acid transferase [Diaphorobacter aerolatus]